MLTIKQKIAEKLSDSISALGVANPPSPAEIAAMLHRFFE